jgi:UDP-2,4-diacetamido-2,4,6-trideoxy-beta-L-altropyranose hydrolase
VDGLGATRVAEAMDPTDITLRHVQEQDCELVWRWANEPRARAVSFSSNPIPWEDHRQWFAEKLHSKNGVFYMATNQHGTPVGQVRVDPGESGSLISVSLDRDFRSLGLGSRVIRAASERAIRERHLERIDALIKAENSASVMAFSKAGYKSVGKETHQGCAAVRMRYGGEARE